MGIPCLRSIGLLWSSRYLTIMKNKNIQMKDIRLNLSVNEINLVLKSLGNLPYYQVFTLIEKIQQQANLQLTQQNGNGSLKEQKADEIINQQ